MANTLKYTDGTGPAFVDGTTGFTATIDVQSLTASRTYAAPDETGTLLVDADLAIYAPLASPTFTGTPAAPTAAIDTSTTQVATTAFVRSTLTTSPTVLTVGDGDTSTLAQSQVPLATAIINAAATLATYTLGLEDGLYAGTVWFVTFTKAVTAMTWVDTNFAAEGLALPAAITINTTFGFVWDDGNGGGAAGWARFL